MSVEALSESREPESSEAPVTLKPLMLVEPLTLPKPSASAEFVSLAPPPAPVPVVTAVEHAGTRFETPPAGGGRVRNRYMDTLRAAALGRVLLFHLFGWFWLPLLFPSMGVMFALAGSLMAASLDRSPATRQVIGRRLRRLLPPLWALGLVLVPVMLALGWKATADGAQPLGPTLGSWVLPVTEPPGSDVGYEWTMPLWYLRTYLWLLLLSPALLWLWRHWPRTMFVLPFLGLLLVSADMVQFDGPVGDSILSVLIFAPCWMVGFAHHDGWLQRVRLPRVLLLGVLLCAAGVAWALRYPIPGSPSPNVSDIPLAQAMFNLGFGIVLLRLPLTMSWVQRFPAIRGFLDVVNRRALTIYLWGNLSVFGANEALDRLDVSNRLPSPAWEPWTTMVATLVVLSLVVLVLGWVEDLAARRRPSLLPLDRATDRVRQPRQVGSPARARRMVSTEDGTG